MAEMTPMPMPPSRRAAWSGRRRAPLATAHVGASRPPAELTVIIVAYRCHELLARCLHRLMEATRELDTSVWVVDNAPDDSSADMVAREFPDVTVIENARNAGFAAANNQVLNAVSSPYVLLLNPDVEIDATAVHRALAVLRGRSEIAVLGGRLSMADGRLDHATKVQLPTLLGAFGHFSGLSRLARAPARLRQYKVPDLGADTAGAVGQVSGAMMFVRREALAQVGVFDESYWMYVEDTDLCRRLSAAGWTIWYEPTVTALHRKSAVVGRPRRPRISWAFHHSMAIFYRRHYAPHRAWPANALVYVAVYGRFAAQVVAGALVRAWRCLFSRRAAR
jgi:GT2 family glycosyltransferase